MITKTTDRIEAEIQEGSTNPLHELVQEMKVSNALKRQQIQVTKDQNELLNLLVHVHEEGLGLNETNIGWLNSRKSQAIISRYE